MFIDSIKQNIEAFKAKYALMFVAIGWVWNGVKWAAVAVATTYGALKYVQWEMKAIAFEVVTPQIKNVETKHDHAMKYMEYRFDITDAKVNRMDGKIDRLLERK